MAEISTHRRETQAASARGRDHAGRPSGAWRRAAEGRMREHHAEPHPPPARLHPRGRAERGGVDGRHPLPHRDRQEVRRARRQEFILLSDTLGATMLIDAINNRKPEGATESSVLGPFYQEGAPGLRQRRRPRRGRRPAASACSIAGRVIDLDGAADRGRRARCLADRARCASTRPRTPPATSFNLCGRLTTGADGRYWFYTRKPVSYTVPGDGPVGAMLRRRRSPQLAPRPHPLQALGLGLRDAGDAALHRRRPLSPGRTPCSASRTRWWSTT